MASESGAGHEAHAGRHGSAEHGDHPAEHRAMRAPHPPAARIGPADHPGRADPDGPAAHGGHGGQSGHIDHTGHEAVFRRRFWICLALSVPVLVYSETIQSWFGYQAPQFPGSGLIVPVLATAVFWFGGWPFLTMAASELSRRSPGMMTLIAMAITVAYTFSMATLLWDLGEDFFWELVTLIDIMLLGHWLEMRSVRQASGALDALANLMPDTAEVVRDDGSTEEVPADHLRTGDVFLVRPGGSAAADGTVVAGSSQMDEAMITGESRPVDKDPGDPVVAGTVNAGDGALRIRVTAIGDETALAGIMRLVAEAQQSKSRTQLLADRAAALLFWAALGAATATFVVWTAIEGGVDQMTVARVVTVLVIACPHALGLAIPLVVANTTRIAAGNGVLIRDREAIDTARLLQVIAMDKTGTLTEGKMTVADIAVTGAVDRADALRMMAAVEGDSEHLIARAVRGAAETRGVDLPAVSGFRIDKGRGVAAEFDGHTLHVGGPRMMESLGIAAPEALQRFAEASGGRGASVVYLVRDREVLAAAAIEDAVRPESRTAVAALQSRGVQVAMLTGDSADVARSVAEELGIDTYTAEVLPGDKERYVAGLQRGGRRVGMVGDGVNDAPALSRADIGIAVGGGTDVAVESAGLILVKNNPLDIVRILMLSAASYRKQVQNIWWGAGYNIVMIPMAAGVFSPWGLMVPPSVGALLMSISTIVVAVNAQLLRRVDLTVDGSGG